jgi:hypothetical protein
MKTVGRSYLHRLSFEITLRSNYCQTKQLGEGCAGGPGGGDSRMRSLLGANAAAHEMYIPEHRSMPVVLVSA